MSTIAVTQFGGELARRVRDQLQDEALVADAHHRLHRKAAVVVAWYVASYLCILAVDGWLAGTLACTSLALSMVAIGFNIQHDANHNAFFSTGGSRRFSVANRLAGLSIYAIGGSSKRWIDGHVIQHHSSPNVVGKDYDIELPPFARLAPSQRRHKWHAWQHLYLWGIYGFTAIGIIIGDIVNTVQESFKGDRLGKAPSAGDYAALIGSKVVYAFAMIVVPMFFHPWWVVLLGVGFVLVLSGFLLGVVFQLAHVVEETEFADGAERERPGGERMRFHEWQVRSSVDFCHGDGRVARLVTWYIGGLNYQTEHHLFPNLPHTLYPVIAPTVAATCADYDIPYHVQPSLRAAVRSHYRHLRELGASDPSVSHDTPRSCDA